MGISPPARRSKWNSAHAPATNSLPPPILQGTLGPMATYAIGDLQGCYHSLRALTDLIGFIPTRDRLWFVGDLVNRGPDSLEVLRYIKGLGQSAVAVLGNHDLFLLAVASGAASLRPKDTLSQVLEAPDRDDLMVWLQQRPLLHHEGEYVLVHAGLLPQWTVEEARQLADEATAALRGERCDSLLRALHPSGHLQWDPSLTGPVRVAAIAKALTRLRTCSDHGIMESTFSGPPELTPAGYHQWFRIASRRHDGCTVLCGHWAALGLRIQTNLLALDSGCVYGRQLTAVRLEDRQVFQVASVETRSRE